MHLLTSSNPKTIKGEEYGYKTYILHLAPHKVSGTLNTCPHATKTCPDWCLNSAGRGRMESVQNARIRRTELLREDPLVFKSLLIADIHMAKRQAKKEGFELAIRLNGTSDWPWEKTHLEVFETFPDVTFYDFTKWPIGSRDIRHIPNYSLCQSYTGFNTEDCVKYLQKGGTVAVMYQGEMPTMWEGFPAHNGDIHDLRFMDAPGTVCMLKTKGKAAKLNHDPAIIKGA